MASRCTPVRPCSAAERSSWLACPRDRVPVESSALEPGQQAGSVPTLAAHLLNLRIERIDQRGDRKARAIAPCFGETNRQILAHPFHCKTEIEFPFVHGLPAVLHLPG